MRILLRLTLGVTFVLCSGSLIAQTATLTENFDNESTVRKTGGSIQITLTDAKFNGDIDDTNPRAAAFLAGMTGQSASWDAVIAGLDRNDVSLNADSTVVTITIGAYSGYFLEENDTITFTIPDTSLSVPAAGTLVATPKIIILNQEPVVSINTLNITENDIRTGATPFNLIISNDEWEDPLSGSFRGYFTGGTTWNTVIQPSLGLTRQSNDTIVVVTIPQVTGFNIESADIISIDVGAADILHTSSGTFSTVNKINIQLTDPVIESATASFNGNSEQSIRDGGSTITLSLSMDDSLLLAVETDNALRESLIRGLQFSNAQTAAETMMEDMILGADFGLANTSFNRGANSVTFTVPAIPNFNIDTDIDVSFEIPASVLELSVISLTTSNFASISRIVPSAIISSEPAPLVESSLNNAKIRVKLIEASWADMPLDPVNFILNINPAIADLTIDHVAYRETDSCDIVLAFTGNIDGNSDLTLVSINGSELASGETIINSSGTVSIQYETEPRITGLNVSGGPFGIGDSLVVDIFVEDDDGNVFTLGGGSIANRVLVADSLRRIDATHYSISFFIEEGSDSYAAAADLPVSGLQLYNGSIPGNIWNTSISSPTDGIDAVRPQITQVSFNGGQYKIGDKITATILAESNLTFDNSTSINGLNLLNANVNGYVIGSGLYQLEYIVEEGNNDIKSVTLPLSIVLRDGAGNLNVPAVTTYSGTSPEIDAHSPTFTVSLETQGYATPGNTVVINVQSDEPGLVFLSGTKVNGIDINHSRLSVSDEPGNLYKLSYVIGPNDPEVSMGALDIDIELKDPFGNKTYITDGFNVDGLAIVTSKPSAIIYGDEDICSGESTSITVVVEGPYPPYTVVIQRNSVDYTTININNSAAPVKVDVSTPTVGSYFFTIRSVTNNLGIEGISQEPAVVTVHDITVPQFAAENKTVYAVSDLSGHALVASPVGGVFSGKGVVSSEGVFYPSVAGVNDSTGYNLLYTYENAYGCVGTDILNVTVLDSIGQLRINTIHSNSEVICFDDPLISVVGNNVDNDKGEFSMFRLDRDGDKIVRVDVSGALIPATDTLVYIDPAQLIEKNAEYEVRYSFIFKGYPSDQTARFDLDYIDPISFSSSIPADICKDESKISLEAKPNDGTFTFSGPGVGSEGAAGYKFYPDQGNIGDNIITYEFISDKGCVRTDYTTIENFDVPEVDFTPLELCVSPLVNGGGGGPVRFANNTSSAALVSKWIWNFDDIASLENNIDTVAGDGTAIEGYHYFTAPLSSNVVLKVETSDGCDAQKSFRIDLGSKPRASFRAESNCWLEGLPTEFSNLSENYNKDWNKFTWEASSLDGSWDTIFETSAVSSKAYIDFPTDTLDYFVNLYVENIANDSVFCSDDSTRTVVLKPTESFDNKDFILMDFESGYEKWSLEADSTSNTNSWTRGVPDFETYVSSASDNNMALFTSKQSINSSERSWIQSRCFDFSSLERPMIRMDMMGSFELNRDGAVLQYTIDDGRTWSTIGNINEGINWYNSFEILSQPGGGEELNGRSPIGWTGKQMFTADTNYWVTVAHDLDYANLAGAHRVIFGIFFASDNSSEKYEGVAVDNIYIGERKKKTLIEHFTSSGDESSKTADDEIDNFVAANELDVTSLQYHMHYPGYDWMNENNPVPSAARSFYYGVNQVPYAYMNGGVAANLLFDFTSTLPEAAVMKALTLEDPEFEISVNKKYAGSDYLSASISVKALKDVQTEDLLLHAAVVEKDVTTRDGDNLDSRFRNVVLDMLPDAAGLAYSGNWSKGDSLSENYRWTFSNVEDAAELMMVVFLQEKESKRVIQVETIDDFAPASLNNNEYEKMHIYPNPAISMVYIEGFGTVDDDFVIEVCDLAGRKIIIQNEEAGQTRVELNVSSLAPGPYVIILKEGGQILKRGTVIVAE